MPFFVAEPQEQFFELFRMQNSQNLLGLPLWNRLGRATTCPKTPQLQNRYLPKLLDTGLGSSISKRFLRIFFSAFFKSIKNKKRSKIDYHFKPYRLAHKIFSHSIYKHWNVFLFVSQKIFPFFQNTTWWFSSCLSPKLTIFYTFSFVNTYLCILHCWILAPLKNWGSNICSALLPENMKKPKKFEHIQIFFFFH